MARFGSWQSYLNPWNYASAATDWDQDLLPGVDTGNNNTKMINSDLSGQQQSLKVTPTQTGTISVPGSGGEALGPSTGTASASVGGAGGGAGVNQAALDAAKANALRGDITTLVNRIKDAFNARYGSVEAAAQEQTTGLNEKFGTESAQLLKQIGQESDAAGSASAAAGTFDSSYRGNTQDTIRSAGQGQVDQLGQGLKEDLAKVGEYVGSEKAKGDAEVAGYDSAVSRLAQSTDLNELTTFKNQVDSRIAELRATAPQTKAQALSTIAQIAPSNPRAQQLQTTLSDLMDSGVDKSTKATLAERLVMAAGLSGEEQRQILDLVQSQLAGADEQEQA